MISANSKKTAKPDPNVYKKGNVTGVVELANRAYLANFEYVKSPLIKKKLTDLKDEKMMHEDFRRMIRNKVSFDELNSC